MDEFIHFFEAPPTIFRAGILIGGLALFWMAESALPLFRFKYKKWIHALPNIALTATTVIINLLLASGILFAADWVTAQKFGLLYLVELPTWAFLLLGLMVLDLIGAYFIHWLEHKIPVLWRFHIIHHSDKNIDSTSANRHHPGESVFRAVFTAIAVLVSGAPMWLVMIYQTVSVILTQFNHANLRLPKAFDRALSYFLVSPNMHKVHHHYKMPLTDTNYGNIFPFWDRIFGTFAEVKNPTEEIVYGIDTHFEDADSDNLGRLLKIPFTKFPKKDK